MWSSIGPIKKANENFLFYKLSTEIGQSGSPIIKEKDGKKLIIGVHIGGNKKTNTAIKLTTQKRKIINEWVAGITGELNLGKFLFGNPKLGDEEIKYLAEEKWSAKLTSLNLCK